jgi:hypothetical protein
MGTLSCVELRFEDFRETNGMLLEHVFATRLADDRNSGSGLSTSQAKRRASGEAQRTLRFRSQCSASGNSQSAAKLIGFQGLGLESRRVESHGDPNGCHSLVTPESKGGLGLLCWKVAPSESNPGNKAGEQTGPRSQKHKGGGARGWLHSPARRQRGLRFSMSRAMLGAALSVTCEGDSDLGH